THELTLELGRDPAFDRQVAAVARFGKMRFAEGRTPGEVQLELLNGRFDEQVVHNAAPVLQAYYDHRQARQGFRHWMKTRPLRAHRGLDRVLGDFTAALATFALFSYLIARYGLGSSMLGEPATIVAVLIAPLCALPLGYAYYRFDRFRCSRRVDRYRRLLGDAGSSPFSPDAPDVLSLKA
ncbi:MAG: hypothetical protein AAFY88_31930, partial [Acidobacteriota bacterium]